MIVSVSDSGDLTIPDGSVVATDAGGELVLRRGVLRVVDGPDRGREVRLDKSTVIVGSSPTADLVLTDKRTSRQHLEIALVSRGVRLRDLQSRNGTFVGDARVGSLVVPFGARVRVGRTVLELAADDVPLPIEAAADPRFGDLLGTSISMRRVFALLARVARTSASVLIHGEVGVGKTAATVALHHASGRSGPLIVLDATEITGPEAVSDALTEAAGGTLLLENVDRATAEGARSLASALEQDEREGGRAARIVCTARDDPRALVEAGALPRDLYFHLATVRVSMPPLRDRPEDVVLLVERFRGDGPRPASGDIESLRERGFPGNVRGLRGMVEAAGHSRGVDAPAPPEDYKSAKQHVVDAFEREYVERLLEENDGNVSQAARAAGMARSHLISLIDKHGLG